MGNCCGFLYALLSIFGIETGNDSILEMIAYLWGSMMVLALLTVLSEWKRIPASAFEKLKFIPMFPMYMLTYIPITVQALFTNVTWTPIQHYSTSQLAMKK